MPLLALARPAGLSHGAHGHLTRLMARSTATFLQVDVEEQRGDGIELQLTDDRQSESRAPLPRSPSN